MNGLIVLEIQTGSCTLLVVVRDGIVEQAPPLQWFMQGWAYSRLCQHCKREGWTMAVRSCDPSDQLLPTMAQEQIKDDPRQT